MLEGIDEAALRVRTAAPLAFAADCRPLTAPDLSDDSPA
jgi:hypothetical protein